MIQTSGLVQRLNINAEQSTQSIACAWIGPRPSSTWLLTVRRRNTDSPHTGAFKNSILDALSVAMLTRREVIAYFDDNNNEILNLEIQGP